MSEEGIAWWCQTIAIALSTKLHQVKEQNRTKPDCIIIPNFRESVTARVYLMTRDLD